EARQGEGRARLMGAPAMESPAPPRESGAATNGPAFVVADVSRTFGGATVLAGIELEIARGERVAVIGPSGAGKTTLLRLLSAAIVPTSGRVIALGRDTSALSGSALRDLRREIAVLHQNDNLVPGLR